MWSTPCLSCLNSKFGFKQAPNGRFLEIGALNEPFHRDLPFKTTQLLGYPPWLWPQMPPTSQATPWSPQLLELGEEGPRRCFRLAFCAAGGLAPTSHGFFSKNWIWLIWPETKMWMSWWFPGIFFWNMDVDMDFMRIWSNGGWTDVEVGLLISKSEMTYCRIAPK